MWNGQFVKIGQLFVTRDRHIGKSIQSVPLCTYAYYMHGNYSDYIDQQFDKSIKAHANPTPRFNLYSRNGKI